MVIVNKEAWNSVADEACKESAFREVPRIQVNGKNKKARSMKKCGNNPVNKRATKVKQRAIQQSETRGHEVKQKRNNYFCDNIHDGACFTSAILGSLICH